MKHIEEVNFMLDKKVEFATIPARSLSTFNLGKGKRQCSERKLCGEPRKEELQLRVMAYRGNDREEISKMKLVITSMSFEITPLTKDLEVLAHADSMLDIMQGRRCHI